MEKGESMEDGEREGGKINKLVVKFYSTVWVLQISTMEK